VPSQIPPNLVPLCQFSPEVAEPALTGSVEVQLKLCVDQRKINLKPIPLALIYMEPITESICAAQKENQREYGFSMGI